MEIKRLHKLAPNPGLVGNINMGRVLPPRKNAAEFAIVSLQPNDTCGLHKILLNLQQLKQWMGSLEIQKQSDNLVGMF